MLKPWWEWSRGKKEIQINKGENEKGVSPYVTDTEKITKKFCEQHIWKVR